MNDVQKTSPPRLSTPLTATLHEGLKIQAVKRRTTLQQLVQDILSDWLTRNRDSDAA